MAFVVVYDASVLFPNTLRDLLLRVAQSGLAQAKWTEEILDEMFAATIQQIADSWRNPPGTFDDALDRLERSGLAVSVAELRAAPLR
jgi:hypothetical protein